MKKKTLLQHKILIRINKTKTSADDFISDFLLNVTDCEILIIIILTTDIKWIIMSKNI